MAGLMRSMMTPVGLTSDDFLKLPDDDRRYELVNGRLVELEMGFRSRYVATRLAGLLGNSLEVAGLAYVIPGCSFTCFPGRLNTVRRPDVGCIRCDRLAFDQIGDGFLPIRPDLAVEVISPDLKVYDLEAKLDDYRLAGIPLVWLVYPPSRRVRVIRLEGPPTDLGPDDVLTGEDVLPGFRCPVADIFAGPGATTTEPGR